MDLQSLFARLEKSGVTTLGQAKSTLASIGIHPSGIWCNHAQLATAVQALKPAVAASGGAAETVASVYSPNQASKELAELLLPKVVAEQIVPEILHFLEGMESRLQDVIAGHIEDVHKGVQQALEAAATKAPAPAPMAAPIPK